MSDGFTADGNRILDEFERTGQIPRMVNEGREGFSMYGFAARAGYLRYRKVYAGGDSTLLSRAAPESETNAELA
jgi:hypothetical protein